MPTEATSEASGNGGSTLRPTNISLHMEDLLSPLAKPSTSTSTHPDKTRTSSSPTELTVAETPSPNGNSFFSPATVQVKRLVDVESMNKSTKIQSSSHANTNNSGLGVKPFDESPSVTPPKPFDEDFIMTWNRMDRRTATTTTASVQNDVIVDSDDDAPDDECDQFMTKIKKSKNNHNRNHQDRKAQLNYVLSRMMQNVPSSPEEQQQQQQISTTSMMPTLGLASPTYMTTSSLAMIASTIKPTKQPFADDEKLQKLQELSALVSEPGDEEQEEEHGGIDGYCNINDSRDIMDKENSNSFLNRPASPTLIKKKGLGMINDHDNSHPPATPPPVEMSARSNRTYGPESPGTPPADLPSLSMQTSTPPPTRVGMPSTPGTSPILPATPSCLINEEDESVYMDSPNDVAVEQPEQKQMHALPTLNNQSNDVRLVGDKKQLQSVLTPRVYDSNGNTPKSESSDDNELQPKNLNFSTIKKVAKAILEDSDDDDCDGADEVTDDTVQDNNDSTLVDTPADEPGECLPPKWEDQDLGSTASSNDDDMPFDCENDYSVLLDGQDDVFDLERGFASFPEPLPTKARRNFSFGGLFRKAHHPWAKELDGISNAVPDEVIDNILSCRQQSASPAELIDNYRRRKGETFEDEPLGSMGLAGASGGSNMSFDTTEYRSKFSLPSPTKKRKKYFAKKKLHKEEEEPMEVPPKRRNRSITCLYICILIVLVGCAILAGLFLSDSVSKKTEQAIEIDDGGAISSTDESSGSNLYEGDQVVACQNAIPLVEMERTYYGSNWKSFMDEELNSCGDLLSIGHSVWYSFTTPFSRLVEASTCNDADFDTKITVMSGSCGELSCVTFNDEYCGHQSKVRWYAQRGTTYYIMVHGHRDASGTFGLTMKESHPHDDCYEATSATPGSVVVGTTSGSHSSPPPTCGNVDTSVPGVWYTIEETSGYQRAELLQARDSFKGQVAVYRSMDEADVGCGALICDTGSASGQVTWLAESKHKYYVFVAGQNATMDGEFELFVGHDYAHSCEMSSKIDPGTIGFLASTQLATPQNVESCGYTGYHTAPGVWFEVVGTGGVLAISTCGSANDLETEISVFSGGCGGLQCVGGTGQDLPCGPNGEISWDSVEGLIYHIYISGRGNRKGDFTLNLSERQRYDGYSCNASLPIGLGNTTVKSETTFAPSESVNVCPGYNSVRGVWHSFIGTGKTLKLSACNQDTEFEAIVSIFTGECGELSCVAHTTTTCGPNDEALVTTHIGHVYHVLVHGPDSFSVGKYRLTIDEAPINDSCLTAPEIDLVNAKYHGSTLSANASSTIRCGSVPAETNGLFYKFTGNGDTVTFSTCNNITDYDTEITIFAGDTCSQLTCVASDDDVCGQEYISFPSVANETYYVRVGGSVSDNDVGNFVLDVTVGSPFFNT
jgi:hypothetical protein